MAHQVLLVPYLPNKSRLLTVASTQYFELPTDIVPGSASWSFGAWVYPLVVNIDQGIISTGGSSSIRGFRLRLRTNGRPAADVRDDTPASFGTADSGTAAVANAWNHVMAVVDRPNNLMSVYLNGVAVSTKDITGMAALTIAAHNRIGRTSTDYYWSGRLARVFYAAAALSGDDIAELCASGVMYRHLSAGLQAKMVHFWDCWQEGDLLDSVGTNHGAETNGDIATAKGPTI